MITTITSKGQVTLPAALRRALKVKTGDKLDFILTEDGEIRGRPVTKSLANLAEVLPPAKRKLSLDEMDAAIREGAKRVEK